MNTTNLTQALALIAPAVMGFVEVLKHQFDPTNKASMTPVWTTLSMVAGVGAALIWQLDAIGSSLGHATHLQGIAGQVITGLGIGGASQVWAGAKKLTFATAKKAAGPTHR